VGRGSRRAVGGPQRAHSASLLPRLSGLRLRLLRPRFAQVPSALIVSDRGKGAVLQVQCPGRLTSVLGQQHQKRPSTRRLSGYGLVYRECRLCRRTFPPALGASRTLAASCALRADLPLCRLILCGRILRVRNLLMILNFAPNQCRSHGSDHAPSQSACTAVDGPVRRRSECLLPNDRQGDAAYGVPPRQRKSRLQPLARAS